LGLTHLIIFLIVDGEDNMHPIFWEKLKSSYMPFDFPEKSKLIIFYLKNNFSTYFWPNTPRKYSGHFDKFIHVSKNSNSNRDKKSSQVQIYLLGNLNVKKHLMELFLSNKTR
jgi:hypothetical protein